MTTKFILSVFINCQYYQEIRSLVTIISYSSEVSAILSKPNLSTAIQQYVFTFNHPVDERLAKGHHET
jgi:hypothetical protein